MNPATTVSSLAEFEYVRDGGNRIESYTGPEGDREYTYDKTNQLLEVAEPGVGVLEEFDFDANGNRDSTGYVTTDGNRLAEDGTFEYIYDNEGNLISKTDPVNHDEWDYTWDNRNRLIHVTATDTNPATSPTVFYEATYTYDVFNRRIGVLEDEDGDGGKPAEQLWTVYDGNNAYADFDGNGDMTTRYLNGRAMDQRFARYNFGDAGTAFYLGDIVNSVRLIADAEGNVLYEADYSAFGMIVSQTGTGGDRFKYTGRELDGTGDYYYRARYYGAGVGRFLSEDPIGFAAGDPNLYRYVGNNSTALNDPSGNIPILLPGVIAIGVILIGAGKNEVEVGVTAVGGYAGFRFVCFCASRAWFSAALASLNSQRARIEQQLKEINRDIQSTKEALAKVAQRLSDAFKNRESQLRIDGLRAQESELKLTLHVEHEKMDYFLTERQNVIRQIQELMDLRRKCTKDQ